MGIDWFEHKGKKILLVDYSGIKLEKEMIAMVNKIPDYLQDSKPDEQLLVLVDLNNCFTTPGFLDASKKLEKDFLKAFQIKRAVIGVTGPKAILLKGYNLIANQKLEPFSSKEEAINYLVK